jgi:hypothetical protein
LRYSPKSAAPHLSKAAWRPSPPQLVLEINVRQLLPAVIFHHKARIKLLDSAMAAGSGAELAASDARSTKSFIYSLKIAAAAPTKNAITMAGMQPKAKHIAISPRTKEIPRS